MTSKKGKEVKKEALNQNQRMLVIYQVMKGPLTNGKIVSTIRIAIILKEQPYHLKISTKMAHAKKTKERSRNQPHLFPRRKKE